jgi:hypothetical protein
MPRQDRSDIVADGQQRILEGSGRDLAARLRARLTRRTAPLSKRANFLGRVVIRLRIARFIRRRLDTLAPPEALYSSPKLSLHSQQPIISGAAHEATRNV